MKRILYVLLGVVNLALTSATQIPNKRQGSNKPLPSEEEIIQSRSRWEKTSDNTKQISPDPTVALEGQCVIVCDADVRSSKVVTSQRIDDVDGEVSSTQQTRAPISDRYLSSDGSLRLGTVKQTKIAFSVMRNSNLGVPDNVAERRTIPFDYITVNIGNGFDAESSTFVAPVGGTYSFNFQIYKLYNKRALTVALMVNNIKTITGFADRSTGDHELAHNAGYIHLRRQDRVNIEIINGDLDGGWKFSTFSGHLLYEDDF